GDSTDVLGDGSDARRSFRLQIDGRCPFLNQCGLCDIVLNLGEEALCRICTDYPRYTFEWGGVTEKSLTLSCPEAERLTFLNDIPISFKEIELQDEGLSSYMEEEFDESVAALPDDAEFEDNWDDGEDEAFASHIQSIREACFKILQNREKPLGERVELYLALCRDAQDLINQYESDSGILDRELPGLLEKYISFEAKVFGISFAVDVSEYQKRLEILDALEVISDRWTKILENMKAELGSDYFRCHLRWQTSPDFNEVHYEHLLVYYTFRYFPRAAYDFCLLEKAKFAVFCTLVIRDLDAARFARNGNSFSFTDRLQTVAEFSREVEHSDYNIETLCEELSFE
ncbi:MAG: flagellin lysine-N-methylase, partial [Lachnospiraceae bacterium]|nr:flagellin lysine-N-methylase [Lachnospiraceae bacterium]